MRNLLGLMMFSLFSLPCIAAPENARIAVLGVFHFQQKKLDLHDISKATELNDKEVASIQKIIDDISEYKPNKIAVENNAFDQQLVADYEAFIAGHNTLDSGEKKQIGFRMAKAYGHKKIYSVDIHQPMYSLGPALEYVQKNQTRLLPFLANEDAIKKLSVDISKVSVAQAIRYVNSGEVEQIHRGLYGALPEAGDTFLNYGAEAAAEWYKRNIGIVGNLARLAEPGDKLLLIIGHAHKGILKDLIKNNPRLEYIEVSDFLNK